MKRTDYYEMSFEILQRRNYSEQTMKSYLPVIAEFLEWVNVPPTKIGAKEFESFLTKQTFNSVSKQNQVISALKFLFEKVLKRSYRGMVDFKRPRGEKKLPRVIDHEEIVFKISEIKNIKHKAILSLIYSGGLRISEAVNLKIEDIDSNRMIIHIRNAKGKKDRIIKLSQGLLKILRDYYKEHKPTIYLFNGQGNNLRYSKTSIRKIAKRLISDKNRVHDLRHSFATYQIDQGVPLPVVAKTLGHTRTYTTEIYLHLSAKSIQQIASPI